MESLQTPQLLCDLSTRFSVRFIEGFYNLRNPANHSKAILKKYPMLSSIVCRAHKQRTLEKRVPKMKKGCHDVEVAAMDALGITH